MSGPMHHDRSYFEGRYRTDPDPWGFDTRWYEQRKYDLTMASLPDLRYRRAQEPGCANGALTERLAQRCDEVHACELIDTAAETARSRLARHPHVTIATQALPEWQPAGTGDLIVWSEVAYYLTPGGFDQAIRNVDRWLQPGGILVAVHYTGTTNYPRSGDDTHEHIDTVAFLDHVTHLREPEFRLDVWRRSPSPSPR